MDPIGSPRAEQPIPTLPDRLRLPLAFDPAPLARDLAALEAGQWTEHYVRQNYEGDWSVLPLRAPAGETHPIRMIVAGFHFTDFVDTPALAASPGFSDVLATLRCPLRNVRLMRLAPGSEIKEHSDPGLDAAEGQARLHLPITTGPEVEFLLNRRRVEMAPGSLWYLRLADPHAVANRGTHSRVHLVIDVDVNPWLIDQLTRGTRD